MNRGMIQHLVLKDWHLQRWVIVSYLAAGVVALAFLGSNSEGLFYAGSVLLLTVLIALGVHLVMATVVQERSEQHLPFIMSLPVSPMEYTTAKILANVVIFLVPWLSLSIGTWAVILSRSVLPDGLAPFATVVLMEILVGYCLVLSVAIVSESQTWAIGAIVLTNLLFQFFLYWVSHIPSVAESITTSSLVWNRPLVTVLMAELVAMALILTFTFGAQARKADFI